ncbi:MAG: MBL fold metallo-hydrolase [Candidatus Acidiferrales bacterium]
MKDKCVGRAVSSLMTMAAVGCIFVVAHRVRAQEPKTSTSAHGVFVVFLGTGMPRPDPGRQGPSLAIVANGKAYIVDAGVGLVRQAAAAYARGIKALHTDQLDIAFLTHLHSDHTLGLPDLIFTPWVMHRPVPLRLYGPTGTQAMVDNIEKAWAEDIDIRVHGLEHSTTGAYKVLVHEIQPGVVYQDANVKVTAFAVLHGSWKEALGYRFDADGKSIVISGDTRAAQSVVDACDGCDILIHEVYSGGSRGSGEVTPGDAYFSSFHTSAEELGGIAAKARPKILVITHYVPRQNTDQTKMLEEIRKKFSGPVMVANDLDVIAP